MKENSVYINFKKCLRLLSWFGFPQQQTMSQKFKFK